MPCWSSANDEVVDVGENPVRVRRRAGRVRVSGLRGLADRIAALDGSFGVADRETGGTVVRATIPLRLA